MPQADRRSMAWRSIFSDRWRRAGHCRRPGRLAFLGRATRGVEARWRAGRDQDGFWAKLSTRSAPLWLASSEMLDAFADDDGLRGQGRGAEHALRNP